MKKKEVEYDRSQKEKHTEKEHKLKTQQEKSDSEMEINTSPLEIRSFLMNEGIRGGLKGENVLH